jgi:hypothetical protein
MVRGVQYIWWVFHLIAFWGKISKVETEKRVKFERKRKRGERNRVNLKEKG